MLVIEIKSINQLINHVTLSMKRDIFLKSSKHVKFSTDTKRCQVIDYV